MGPESSNVKGASQNVGDDPAAPEVGGWSDRLVVGDLWRTELGRRVLDVQLACRVVGAREAEVGHFELVRRMTQQQQVLRLSAHATQRKATQRNLQLLTVPRHRLNTYRVGQKK